jgi:predicted TIM-barrel fold metal-dependent hydrolase
MFIDLTPGTPAIYRREALTKIFTVGYKVADNVLFGTDGTTAWYNTDWAPVWIKRDDAIYDELGLSAEARKKIYHRNLERFIGG